MSVLDELLNEAQPGYAEAVRTLLLRFRDSLGEAAFEGVEAADFPLRSIGLIEASDLGASVKLQLVSDLASLGWWCNFELPDEAAGAMAALARRAHYQEAQTISAQLERPDPAARNAHVVFAGQMNTQLHSPTRGAFDYVRALAADPANRRVDVFHSGIISPELRAYGEARLGLAASGVNFIRTDDDPNFLAKAVGQGPATYHFWCEQAFSIHVGLMSMLGPTVMFTCGDAAPVQFADVYWYCHEADYMEALWRRKGAPAEFAANYRQTESAPFNRTIPLKARTRADFGFGADETVIVTAGNRLGVDMDQAFVDGMAAMVLEDPRRRWVMVGGLQDFWIGAFEQVLGAQFTHIPFDADLAGLFALCDVYANPFRAGGGNTAVMAIDAGCVVMTRGDLGDVGAFVPAAHRAGDADSYFAALDEVTSSPVLRAAWLAGQQTLLARRLDQDLFARELKELVSLAWRRFAARTPTPLEVIFAQPLPKRLALKAAGRRPRLR